MGKRMLDLLTSLATFAVTTYAVIVLVLFVAQRHLLYYPRGALPDPAPPFRAVTFPTADGLKLVAWYAPPAAQSGRVVVIFHGNADSIANRAGSAGQYLAAGLGVLLVEYRGFGGNPGSPTEQGLYEDGRGALRWLGGQGIPADRVVLLGESLGTGVAVHLASETRPAGVILQSPYTSVVDAAARQYWFVPARWLVLDRFESLAKIAKVSAPLLIVHGERDGLIPAEQGLRLFAAANQPKKLALLPQANHVDTAQWGGDQAIMDFLKGLP